MDGLKGNLRVAETETDCPVCNGAGRMSIVNFSGAEKKSVKIRCTACGGKGWVTSVNYALDGIVVEAKVEEIKDKIEIRGWRCFKDWKRVHYFIKGQSLCGNIRSEKSVLSSLPVVDLEVKNKCSICLRKSKNLEQIDDRDKSAPKVASS